MSNGRTNPNEVIVQMLCRLTRQGEGGWGARCILAIIRSTTSKKIPHIFNLQQTEKRKKCFDFPFGTQEIL